MVMPGAPGAHGAHGGAARAGATADRSTRQAGAGEEQLFASDASREAPDPAGVAVANPREISRLPGSSRSCRSRPGAIGRAAGRRADCDANKYYFVALKVNAARPPNCYRAFLPDARSFSPGAIQPTASPCFFAGDARRFAVYPQSSRRLFEAGCSVSARNSTAWPRLKPLAVAPGAAICGCFPSVLSGACLRRRSTPTNTHEETLPTHPDGLSHRSAPVGPGIAAGPS